MDGRLFGLAVGVSSTFCFNVLPKGMSEVRGDELASLRRRRRPLRHPGGDADGGEDRNRDHVDTDVVINAQPYDERVVA